MNRDESMALHPSGHRFLPVCDCRCLRTFDVHTHIWRCAHCDYGWPLPHDVGNCELCADALANTHTRLDGAQS